VGAEFVGTIEKGGAIVEGRREVVVPVEIGTEGDGEDLRDEIRAGSIPEGGLGLAGGEERFVAGLDEADVVGAVVEELHVERRAADLLIVEVDEGAGGRGGDRDGALNAAGEPEGSGGCEKE